MDSAITRLLKVLDLERKQGYRNKAVIGGLDKFASRWESDARAETGERAGDRRDRVAAARAMQWWKIGGPRAHPGPDRAPRPEALSEGSVEPGPAAPLPTMRRRTRSPRRPPSRTGVEHAGEPAAERAVPEHASRPDQSEPTGRNAPPDRAPSELHARTRGSERAAPERAAARRGSCCAEDE